MGTAGSVTQRLTDFLRANELLLILDNCEHLVEPCAWLADTLLRSAPACGSWPPAERPRTIRGGPRSLT
jgi:predicted ATPase